MWRLGGRGGIRVCPGGSRRTSALGAEGSAPAGWSDMRSSSSCPRPLLSQIESGRWWWCSQNSTSTWCPSGPESMSSDNKNGDFAGSDASSWWGQIPSAGWQQAGSAGLGPHPGPRWASVDVGRYAWTFWNQSCRILEWKFLNGIPGVEEGLIWVSARCIQHKLDWF